MKNRILSCVLMSAFLLPLLAGSVPAVTANAEGDVNHAIEELNAGATDSFITTQKELLDEPDMEYRPGSRWWMAEGLHTDETIIKTVKELHDMGIGLIEFVCRDGGARLSDDLDRELWPNVTRPQNIYSWGSEEWGHDSMLAIQEATKYGMGFSITSGTNWGNANVPREYLKPDDDGAGKSLGYKIQVIEGGERFNGELPRSFIAAPSASLQPLLEPDDYVKRQDLVAVVAMKRDPSSDATLVESGNTAGTIAMTNSAPDRVMVYDDSKTQVLTDLVTLNGTPVTEETMIDPTGEAEFTLDWTPPDNGTWDIYCFWVQATGQSPTPSSDVNFTINYVDPTGIEVLKKFYEEEFFAGELKEVIIENGKGEIYMDSIEISTTNGQTGQFWGLTFMDEFEDRHGYDLSRYLPYIIRSGGRAEFTKYHTKMLGSDGVTEEKIRSDVYDVMTNCYIENVLVPLKTWLNDELNMKLRAEIAYNLPYEVSLSGRGVDYVEAESLDYGEQIETYRTTAGAANVYGRRLSSETGALAGQNYAHGLERYMRTVNTQFAGGVQYTVWHGYASLSGPVPLEDDGRWVAANNQTWWPGGEVMSTGFSDRLGPRQPAFGHYGDFMTKIARDQAVLQQGKSQIDLAIFKTDYYNVHNYEGSSTDVDTMRNRKAMFMKDLSLQDAGYTYNYFAPENLEVLAREGSTLYREGEGLIPDSVGYQAVVVYQENLRVESAEILLDLAEQGLPVVIVNGLTARHMTTKGASNYGQAIGPSHLFADVYPHYVATSKLHEEAGVYTVGLDTEGEKELSAVMGKIKALDNVVELSPESLPKNPNNPDPEAWGYDDEYFYNKTGILEALQDLGVHPRAEFEESNKNFLTTMRRTNDTLYLWVYNFMSDDEFKPQAVTFDLNNDINISVSEAGKPYTINTWTGEIAELGAYTIENGRTSFDLTLESGETTVIALDLNNSGDGLHAVSTDADKALLKDGVLSVRATESGTYTTRLSDGTVAVNNIEAPDNISLDEWDLTVEDWTRGELVTITENRGKGYTTTEAYWTTNKTPIEVGKTTLIPWQDIPAVGPAVSGTGTYTTTFELPEDWSDANGAYLDIESLCRNTAYVWVNGQRAIGLDIVTGAVDVSELLQPGSNTIEVEVSSTLRNRMIDLNYPGINPTGRTLDDLLTNGYVGRPGLRMPVADYGMTGEVVIVTYTEAEEYTVTYDANGGAGQVPIDSNVYDVNSIVTVRDRGGLSKEGYSFAGWNTQADGNGTGYSPGTTFKIEGSVTLYAIWKVNPATYSVTYNANGGTGQVPVDSHTYYANTEVTVRSGGVLTKDGYVFVGWNTQANGKGTSYAPGTTFIIENADVTLYAVWKVKLPFTDADEDDWYYEAVEYTYVNELFNGTSPTTFEPQTKMTREMFVTVLARTAERMGEDTSGYTSSFMDIKNGQWYTEAVSWGAAKGLVKGYDSKTFGLGDDITREQMAALFVRFADYMEIELDTDKGVSYADAASISDWAKADVKAATDAGLFVGDNGSFYPKRASSRAEVAQVFMNFCKLYND